MRLDKYLCESTDLTRSQARSALLAGEITVNGEVIKKGTHVVRDGDVVQWDDETLAPIGLRYIMLNKPVGYECTLRNSQYPPVISLLDVDKRDRLHTVGRLDVETTGLILITDDGQWTHRIISPRHRCDKVYVATLAEPLPDNAEDLFAAGILLDGEDKPTLPAVLERVDERRARLTIQEGKYHQVRRMFASLGNHVLALHRERIGSLALDADLLAGESRYLTPIEVADLAQNGDVPV
ncbi:pseudouridine synthase [Candidimonas sp. SYP-B2681]|uniref:pseudouridine synthase n=1 Tax=Candidimonas sp. SYP-B2681 TaxID=2497686 RepID=UPI000F87AF7F|nr:pseudouridine synthase [Candidimonas sp. SYP-B2681]RTZ47680.1 pseudouridine synthase [Candidimonas sp. SYP-B2681]